MLIKQNLFGQAQAYTSKAFTIEDLNRWMMSAVFITHYFGFSSYKIVIANQYNICGYIVNIMNENSSSSQC